MSSYPVFDGHNDTLLRLVEADRKGAPLDFLNGAAGLHIDMPKARAGGFVGGLFAMFTPSPERAAGFVADNPKMGEPITHDRARNYTLTMMDKGDALIEEAEGAIALCLTASDIRDAIANDKIAMVYHIEGAEAVDADFQSLDALYARGLRSIGIVWSRNNIFGHGVPFNFPGSPDQGSGLTDLGIELVRQCNQRKMMIDLSHLNEKGFWDVARYSHAPLVASHSNAHALSATPRNLTDKQLDAIAETGGLVGLNYAVGFVRADGSHAHKDTPLEDLLRHLDYLVERLGENGVGLGSDFDGCNVPADIGDASGLPNLVAAMERADYGKDLIAKITHGNWIDLLERTL